MFDVKKYVLCRKNLTTTVIASADELQSLVERGKDIAFDCVDNPFFSPIAKRELLEELIILDASTEEKIDTELDDMIALMISDLPEPTERAHTQRYYFPTISCECATNLLKYAEEFSSEIYANMVADIVIKDIQADLEAGWGDDAKTYYAIRFLTKLCDSRFVSEEKKRELSALLR